MLASADSVDRRMARSSRETEAKNDRTTVTAPDVSGGSLSAANPIVVDPRLVAGGSEALMSTATPSGTRAADGELDAVANL